MKKHKLIIDLIFFIAAVAAGITLVVIWPRISLISISLFLTFAFGFIGATIRFYEIDEIENKKVPPKITDRIIQSEEKSTLASTLFIMSSISLFSAIALILEFDIFDAIENNFTLIMILLSFMGVVLMDFLLMKFRVKHGWYGTNTMEAIEIIKFLMKHRNNNDIGPHRTFHNGITESISEEVKDKILKPTSIS